MNPQNDNHQQIVRYLLNELPEDEQLQFEGEYFADHDLFEQMEAVEEDLIEDYIRDRLTATERAQFERHYLATPERREKIAFAEALVAVASERATPAIEPSPSPWWSWLLPKPAVAWAFVALLLVVCFWLFVETRRLRNQANHAQVQTAEREQQQRQLAQDLQQQAAAERERSDQLTKELADAQNQLAQLRASTPKSAQPQSLLATIIFQPPTQAAVPTQDLVIRPGVSSVQLVCRFHSNVFKSYRAVLRPTSDGNAVWDQSGLKLKTQTSGNKAVVVALPVYLFTTTGNYTLTLSGVTPNGDSPEISYSFRVIRQ